MEKARAGSMALRVLEMTNTLLYAALAGGANISPSVWRTYLNAQANFEKAQGA